MRFQRCARVNARITPGRGFANALDALVVGIDSTKVNWIVDADIRSFFDEVSQDWLIRFVEHRIGDKRIVRLIHKWLKAGVLEDGVVIVGGGQTTAAQGRPGRGVLAAAVVARVFAVCHAPRCTVEAIAEVEFPRESI
jgi:hypothetical protein